jgi:hypothetical protein
MGRVSHPQQPWEQPAQPWGQQPPPYPPQQAWGQQPPPRPGGGAALLVLGLVTAALGLAGTVLPSIRYPDDVGYYGPLVQNLGGDVRFLAAGLVSLAAVVLLVVGALVQRGRPAVGTGLLLVGGGMVALSGLEQLFSILQAVVSNEFGTGPAVGGVLLALAGCTATAVVVLGLVRLSRLR